MLVISCNCVAPLLATMNRFVHPILTNFGVVSGAHRCVCLQHSAEFL